jgi:hypothetical protein
MSHLYQPLMLMELLGRRNPTPAQDVARILALSGAATLRFARPVTQPDRG